MKNTQNNDEVKKIEVNNSKKRDFFKRIKNAIFELENYGEFILEKTRVAIFYFVKLMFLVAIIISAVSTYNFNIIITKGFNYIKNELPEFNYSAGKVIFNEDKEAYDSDLDFYTIINTQSEISDSIETELINKVKDYSMSLILLEDKIIFTEYGQEIEYTYSELESNYNVNILNKEQLVNMLDSIGIFGINLTYFIASLLTVFIINIITISIDVLLIFVFGNIISKLCGVHMPPLKVLSISIYSLTLSILLSMAYSVLYNFTGFVIEYFDIMYLMIAYVYLIAAILIIKCDVLKQKVELQKIIEVQKQVKKELDEQKQDEEKKEKDNDNEKQNKKEEEEEPMINREPDGSEI